MEQLVIPTSIAQMFQTNFVPSQMDAEHISKLRNAHYTELAAINVQVAHAHSVLSKLEHRKNELTDVIGELEALISPIRRMPTEIIAKVFEHCIHSSDGMPRANALLLAQVCSAWRELLLAYPCMWTSLEIIFPPKSSDLSQFIQNKITLLRCWLERAKSLPVSLTLTEYDVLCIPWTSLILLDNEIMTTASRLEAMSLNMRSSTMATLLTFTQCDLPILRRLEYLDSAVFAERQSPPPIMLHSAPLLRGFSVSWCSLQLRDFQVPWEQLTELSLLYNVGHHWEPNHSDYLSVLSKCRNLVSCSLGVASVIQANHFQADDSPPIVLPRLETLQLRFHTYSSYHRHLLNALELPKLRVFAVQNGRQVISPYRGQTECFPLVIRSAHTLENLVLDSIDVPDSDVVDCLEHTTNLRSLHFVSSPMRLSRDLIPALTVPLPGDRAAPTSQATTCPRMEDLHLRCSSGVPVETIAHMVKSRCRETTTAMMNCDDGVVVPHRCLKKFCLDYTHVNHSPDIRDEKMTTLSSLLGECVEKGLELMLTKSHASRK